MWLNHEINLTEQNNRCSSREKPMLPHGKSGMKNEIDNIKTYLRHLYVMEFSEYIYVHTDT